MFERYTEKARRVIFFARFEASRSEMYTGYIEPAHLLLALAREAAELLEASGRDLDTIRKSIESHAATKAGKPVSTSADMPLSHPSKRALSYAAEEAERLAQQHITPAHLLLGLMREAPGLVQRHIGYDDLSALRERFARASQPEMATPVIGTVHAGMTSAGPLPPERAAVLHAVAAALKQPAVTVQITTRAGTQTFSFAPEDGTPSTPAS